MVRAISDRGWSSAVCQSDRAAGPEACQQPGDLGPLSEGDHISFVTLYSLASQKDKRRIRLIGGEEQVRSRRKAGGEDETLLRCTRQGASFASAVCAVFLQSRPRGVRPGQEPILIFLVEGRANPTVAAKEFLADYLLRSRTMKIAEERLYTFSDFLQDGGEFFLAFCRLESFELG